MIRTLAFALLISLLTGCGTPAAPPAGDNRTATESRIEVSAQTDRTTASVDEPIRFTLRVTYPPGLEAQLPEVGSKIAGLRIVDFGEDGPNPIDNRLVYQKWYELRADIVGAYIIPSLSVSCTGAGETQELETPQIFIQVKSLTSGPDNESMQDIVDIKPLETVPRDMRPFIWGGSAALALVLASLGIFFYLRGKKAAAQAPRKPAHILAYEELEQLDRERLIEKGVVHEHYFRLSDIFRRYIENRFRIPAVEQTTQELLPALNRLAEMTPETKERTKEFLVHSDLVKFARYLPGAEETDRSRQGVRAIIEQTKLEPAEADAKKEASNS